MRKTKIPGRRLAAFYFVLPLLLAVVAPAPATANSGPIYEAGTPLSPVFAVNEESAIHVTEETLIFDLSAIAGNGTVTARYHLYAEADHPAAVQMAFPYLGNLHQFLYDPPQIRLDGQEEACEYQVLLGTKTYERYNWAPDDRIPAELQSLEAILATIAEPPATPVNFDLDAPATLYTFSFDESARRHLDGENNRLYLKLKLDASMQDHRLLANYFNSYTTGPDGVFTELGSSLRPGQETCQILVFAGQLDYTATVHKGYQGGELSAVSSEVTVEQGTARQLIQPFFENTLQWLDDYPRYPEHPELEEQLYELFLANLDQRLTESRHANLEDLYQHINSERLMLLVFTVDFEPQAETVLTVTCPISPTANRTKEKDYIYTYDYLFNPARHWASFGQLTVMIEPPDSHPVLYQSNLEFSQLDEQRQYRAVIAELPAEDLTFSLYTMTAVEYEQLLSRRQFIRRLSLLGGALILILLAFFLHKRNTP